MATVEGVIREVLECWPLELVLRTESGRTTLTLAEEAQITKLGEAAAPGDLLPGDHVRCRTEEGVPGIAQSVEVVD